MLLDFDGEVNKVVETSKPAHMMVVMPHPMPTIHCSVGMDEGCRQDPENLPEMPTGMSAVIQTIGWMVRNPADAAVHIAAFLCPLYLLQSAASTLWTSWMFDCRFGNRLSFCLAFLFVVWQTLLKMIIFKCYETGEITLKQIHQILNSLMFLYICGRDHCEAGHERGVHILLIQPWTPHHLL